MTLEFPAIRPSFERELESALKRLLRPGHGVLLAVSGGRDSMALLHGTAKLLPLLEIPELVVAHLNHGLRGRTGQVDAELVAFACKSLDLPVIVSECRAGELQQASRGSLEESARNARYEFLASVAREHHLPFVATAHHASDQAETVLHNILRGTGLRGLRGIPERRSLCESIELIRPMLSMQTAMVNEYVQRHNIAFACDETNSSSEFTRNRIRGELMPHLQSEFNQQIADSLVRLADQSQELLEGLDAVADSMLMESILEQTPDLCRLDTRNLQAHAEPIVRHSLMVLWIRQDWPRRDMNRTHLMRLSSMVTLGNPSAIDLPGGVRAELRGNLLVLQTVRSRR